MPGCLLVCLALTACGTTGPAPLSGPTSAAQFCDRPQVHDARQQDRLLRFAAIVRDELDDSGEEVALISRSGIDLAYLGIRYSHSGVSVKGAGDVPWSVRQLYYACDEGRPRLYDQGVAGFLFNSDDAQVGYVSIVLLPREEAAALQRTALDRPRALRLLAGRYSANAYPFSTRYQNCNQWVIELMAAAWGRLDDGNDLRERAQAWLAASGYAPAPIDLDSHPLKFAAAFMPLVHLDDHPDEARYGLSFQVSLPASMESFVHTRMPQAKRIELCHDDRQVVIRQGWRPIDEGCRPEAGDRVIALG
ncbi:MAG: DUF2145 domain-containing protein [Lautropia sp.]|nr:DUF2145 domain-containing protein [Lautropia sp.]